MKKIDYYISDDGYVTGKFEYVERYEKEERQRKFLEQQVCEGDIFLIENNNHKYFACLNQYSPRRYKVMEIFSCNRIFEDTLIRGENMAINYSDLSDFLLANQCELLKKVGNMKDYLDIDSDKEVISVKKS